MKIISLLSSLIFVGVIFIIFGTVPLNAQDYYGVHSPRYDIAETQHIVATKPAVQVGEDVFFTATIKNVSSNPKHLTQLGYESSYANIGLINDIDLGPGQSFSFGGMGVWHEGGPENVWVTWSQDRVNFYRPLNSKTVQVYVVD